MRARLDVTYECDHDLLEEGAERCPERGPGYLVLCIGSMTETDALLQNRSLQVLQPLQIGLRNPAWAVLTYGTTTYVFCPKHVAAGRQALANKAQQDRERAGGRVDVTR